MFVNLIQALVVLLALISSTFWLRKRGIVERDDAPTFTRIVTDLMLPAIVFANLSTHKLEAKLLLPGLVMAVSVVTALGLAWLLGRVCGLTEKQLGSLILVSGFGSSASVGYALVGQVFPDDPAAIFDAVIINSIGSTVPMFALGVPIAAHFGGQADSKNPTLSALRTFVSSPIFAALALGLVVSVIGVPKNLVTDTLYRVLHTLGAALPVVVALTIGLMLRPVSLDRVWKALLVVGSIKLLIEPFLVAEIARVAHVDGLGRHVLLIEAAMPSGTIAAVLAARYGCDSAFASTLVVLTYVAALASTPLIVFLVG